MKLRMAVDQTSLERRWRYGLGVRILIGFVALFMYGIAAVLICLPLLESGSDHSFDWIIYLTGGMMVLFGMFMTFYWMVLARTSIRLNGANLEAIVPAHHTWYLAPEFRRIDVPLRKIRSVDRRQEIWRSFGASNLRESLSIVTDGGERIGVVSNSLGYSPTLPIDDIASSIASAAGVSVTNGGTVRSKDLGLYGATSSSWNEPKLDPAVASAARRAAYRTMQIVTALMLVTLVLRGCF